MSADDFAERVADVAVLADPLRQNLYLFVIASAEPVSRDLAAAGIGVPRHTAKFHLDKLVEQGLLDITFRRLSGRRGPGAGRPTKLYRRSARQVSVTLPERRYDLAGELLAQAIEDSDRDGTPVVGALRAAAGRLGRALADRTLSELEPDPAGERRIEATRGALAGQGYEPRSEGDAITLANCPFDALARGHVDLVCGMNLALVGTMADCIGDGSLDARLDPADDRCCVVLDVGRPGARVGRPDPGA